MNGKDMFRREIHYFIATKDIYINNKIVITDPEHEKHVIRLINNEIIEHNVNVYDKNEYFFQRYEYGKKTTWFNWQTKIFKQERLEF